MIVERLNERRITSWFPVESSILCRTEMSEKAMAIEMQQREQAGSGGAGPSGARVEPVTTQAPIVSSDDTAQKA